MSTRYPGGIITKTPVVPTGPAEDGTAPGIWTLEQQLQFQKTGIWPTAGVKGPDAYIENLFSTYLYTGNGSTQTITNGIDLSGKGGLVWIKDRDSGTRGHGLYDTVRGVNLKLQSQSTNGQFSGPNQLTAFNANGFSLGSSGDQNASGVAFVSWTFREQPKFFDVVTWTGNSTVRTIAHNLGSVPGCIIVKETSAAGQSWYVYHRSIDITTGKVLILNLTNAVLTNGDIFNSTLATSTNFTIGIDSAVNYTGNTYVAYLFAHNAGGFGLTGTDNVISCGSFTTDVSGNATINLGYEPQWILRKLINTGNNWVLSDTMRGLPASGNESILNPNNSAIEATDPYININSTGFSAIGLAGEFTYIYIAIRRGPMKVPTVGTTVFAPLASRSSGSTQAAPLFNAGWPVDLLMQGFKSGSANAQMAIPRLTNNILRTSTTGAETNGVTGYDFGGMLGVLSVGGADNTDATICGWNFRRAPGFFSVACYAGNSTIGRTVAHDLSVVPELMIVKNRTAVGGWIAYLSSLGATKFLQPNSTNAASTSINQWNNTAPTASVFTVDGTGGNVPTNASGNDYVAYLFATCPGVSKVGSYTGTGTTQTINCGFTSGARFVLIKCSSDNSTDWYVWDSARGIVAGNDPYLLLNSSAAEDTGTDYVDTAASGFQISSTAPAAINANGGSFIFFAVS